jgi:hypothetical protein
MKRLADDGIRYPVREAAQRSIAAIPHRESTTRVRNIESTIERVLILKYSSSNAKP